jgi:D-alanyl-D-alanine dipeptidase
MIALLLSVALAVAGTPAPHPVPARPADFVYLRDVAPTIVQDIRYAGYHNFLGRPVAGYEAPECILTRRAAEALAKVQAELEANELTLRVYDCYRPQRAVNDFIAWSKVVSDQRMKTEFYPRVDKALFFKLGYVAAKSGHTRGSTVDLTIERLPPRAASAYAPGDPLVSCIAPYIQRYHDGSLDMGTGFDCMDELSHPGAEVGSIAEAHRRLLEHMMEKNGFKGIKEEWWHFTLAGEPYPKTYFDFPITRK